MSERVIDIGSEFTRFPAGRYVADGIYSGERFRDQFLIPALLENDRVLVKLDGTMGYGSSFLEEAFGGLTRDPRFTRDSVLAKLKLESLDQSIIDEILSYIE